MSKLSRKTFTAAQAKSHFADSLRAAEEGGVVVITRYGKPVAALVHFSELENLDRLRNQSSQDGLGGLLHRWDDANEFTQPLDQIERSSSGTLPQLD
ncbi:type II toxin-antitoxin system prevent-host-death family antitoxin [bacterium]|nr:type II toxin-antitoxin system prevent-host-death family antitoxin [bacterium]